MKRFRIDPARSRVVIDGRSSLHPIHTEITGLEGWLELELRGERIDLAHAPRGHIEFPVDKLRSGNVIEDKELQRRIESGKFPTISGELESVREDGDTANHVVEGAVTFRGVTRRYENHMTIEAKDGSTLTLAGQAVFDIRDFGMAAPRVLMFKVDPQVTVRIDVVAERERA